MELILLKDFLICIEMFVASIAHILAFPIGPYKLDETLNWWSNIANAANVSDFNSEVSQHYNHFYAKVKNYVDTKKNGKSNQASSQNLNNDGDGEEEPCENSRLLTPENNEDYYGPYVTVISSVNSNNDLTEII